MTKTEEALALMQKMVETGEAPTMGDAYVLVGKRFPHLIATARAETPVHKTTADDWRDGHAAQQLVVSDPPGVLKAVDGSLKSDEEQRQHFKQHPAAYQTYVAHFRRQR